MCTFALLNKKNENMTRFCIMILLAFWALTATSQTAREEIKKNARLSGSNYLAYPGPQKQLTPAPKGYVPYYMSHYGRHGSRWLISENSYTCVLEPLRKAHEAGKLTQLGEGTLRQLEQFVSLPVANYPELDGRHAGAQPRLGDLTTVGLRQHHGIGRRMARNFPEIFKRKGVAIDARSTTVNRCILSMIAECEELMAANPTARIHNDVSDALQYYMNAPRTGLVKEGSRKGREIRKQLGSSVTPARLMQSLFNDPQWAADSIQGDKLMSNLFEVVTNMQSHGCGEDMWNLFTKEECYDLWRAWNIDWYLGYGPAPQTGSIMQFSQANLLRNIIETTDTVMASKTYKNGAALRFGHEVCVMPLACLLELDNCGMAVDNLDELDKYWRNYRIFPMACNIQLIFYRPKKGSTGAGDILVKALLNEREMTLPVSTATPPYYRWQDLRDYYTQKLRQYRGQ